MQNVKVFINLNQLGCIMDIVSSDDEIDRLFDKSNQTPDKPLKGATTTEESTPTARILSTSRSGNTPDTLSIIRLQTGLCLRDQRYEPVQRGRNSL